MIVVKVFGGLGNQMFQYAAGRRLAATHGTDLHLHAAALEGTTRRFALGTLRIAATVTDGSDLPVVRGRHKHRWRRLLGRLGGGDGLRYVPERSFRFDPSILELGDGVYLDGYWQCEQYFRDVAALVREELSPAEPLGDRDREMLTLIEGCCAVSLHVRRGDFVSEPRASRYHGVCDVEYFRRAAAFVADRVERPRFFVFSDEPEWARDHLDLGHPTVVVDHNDAHRAAWDLHLMSRCHHHVIANSSFSWWGAWLDPRPDAVICAPRRWFADPRPDTSTIVPERWVRL